MIIGALGGLIGLFFFWPEAQPPSAQPGVSIKQEGTTTNSPNIVGSHNTVNLGGAPESPSPLSLEFRSRAEMLPIAAAPHQEIYVLGLHPKITENLSTLTNGGETPLPFPIDWPKIARDLTPAQRLSTMIWRCEITNPNSESLLGIAMTFSVTFRESNASGGSRTTDPIFAGHQHPIEIPGLKSHDSFVFYLVNESPYWTEVEFPDHAQADVVGRVGRANIPIVRVGVNSFEQLPSWTFQPSDLKWHTVSGENGNSN